MIRNLLLIALAVSIISCGKSDKVQIRGSIENGDGKTIYLEKVEVGSSTLIDSVKLKVKGKFSFRIKNLNYPSFYNLKISNRNFITLLVEPSEKIEFKGNASDILGSAVISGSNGSQSIQKLNLQLRKTITEIISFVEASEKAQSEEKKNKIAEEIDFVMKEQRKFSIGFILDNMESLASITALYQKYDDENWVLNELRDLQYLKIVSESLVIIWPESPHVKALVKDIEAKLADYNLSLLLASTGNKTQVASNYPDLALPNTNGDTLKISSLKARYVLVVFSASWNKPSVEHDLAFKPLYDAYKNKGFDIYQVSLERNTQEWVRNITFNELKWNHVSELNLLNSMAANIYNVTNLPANFFIDKNTGILAKNITPRELNQKLSAIFN